MTARFASQSVPITIDPDTKPHLEREATTGKPLVTIPFPGGSYIFATDPCDLDAIARIAAEGARMLETALTEQPVPQA
jgi:hypothetical protein